MNGKLIVHLFDGASTELKDAKQFAGFQGKASEPSTLILVHHQIHLIIQFDKNHPVGSVDLSGIKDVKIESAISSIIDCEDSVAAVDGYDKAEVYLNWLGLMRGDLTANFEKNGSIITRKLKADIEYQKPDGKRAKLRATSLLLVRNVGHLTTTNAVLYDNQEVFEGLLDAYITSAIATLNLKNKGRFKNSTQNSIYIVKPKMHGPKEADFANRVYAEVEKELGLKANTIKLGVMDEERRTSVNLKAAIAKVKTRVCFINTGFLDRTGDEIHTHMELAPVPLKADFKQAPWMVAYEQSNVATGLQCGFYNQAQIGKGMWAKSDDMESMLKTKQEHLIAGASCAWVPSPTAASLHALHYLRYDVKSIQKELMKVKPVAREAILEVFTLNQELTETEIQNELENNCQGILGYVVRWVNQGVGCSKVLDIEGTALMEDRATLRISSQHIANWLNHRIITSDEVETALKKMAKLVDSQNNTDSQYEPMALDFEKSIAFQTARDLIFKAKVQPNGYTEPLLHQRRLQKKNQ